MKTSGLGDNFYLNGFDLSGDVNALSKIGGGPTLLDVTAINDSAIERIGGQRSGEMAFVAWWNSAALQEHAALSQLLTTDQIGMYFRGTTLGNPCACLNSQQIGYNPTRAANGALSEQVQLLSDAFPLHWGRMLTAGKRTDTAAGNGTGVDQGAAQIAPVNISSVAVANPGQVNATAHGLVTGDSVTIAGTTTTPSINGDYPVTVLNANAFTIPVNVTGGQAGAAGTVQQTSYDFGASLYVAAFSFTGTSITVKIQHSADNGVSDAYTDITGATTTAITSAPTAQRADTAATAAIKRWVRLVSVGAFNPCTYAVGFCRHHAAGAF